MPFKLRLAGAEHEIEIVRYRPRLVLSVDGRLHEVAGLDDGGDGAHAVAIDGAATRFVRAAAGGRAVVRAAGRTFAVDLVDPRDGGAGAGHAHDAIRAPMPGAVVSVHKAAGDAVRRGETIVTIESMKLQTALVAPRDGVLARLGKAEGQTFEKDEVVAELEPLTGDE